MDISSSERQMDFSAAVSQVMVKLSLRRSDLARLTNYSHQYISDLLTGERRWNEDSINRVCEALGIQVNFTISEQAGEQAEQIQH